MSPTFKHAVSLILSIAYQIENLFVNLGLSPTKYSSQNSTMPLVLIVLNALTYPFALT